MSIDGLTAAAPGSLAAACSAALEEREQQRRATSIRGCDEQALRAATEGELQREAAAAAGRQLSKHFSNPGRWQVEALPNSDARATAVVEVDGVRVRYGAGRHGMNGDGEHARLYHLRRCPESGSTHPDNWRACQITSLADLAELLRLAAQPDAGTEIDRRYPRTSCGDCRRLDQHAPTPPPKVDADGFRLGRAGAVDRDATVDRALVAMRYWIGQAEQIAVTEAKHLTLERCTQLVNSWALVALAHGAPLDTLTGPHSEA